MHVPRAQVEEWLSCSPTTEYEVGDGEAVYGFKDGCRVVVKELNGEYAIGRRLTLWHALNFVLIVVHALFWKCNWRRLKLVIGMTLVQE